MIYQISILKDTNLISCGIDKTIRNWLLKDGTVLSIVKLDFPIYSIFVNEKFDGQIYFCGFSNKVYSLNFG